MTVSLPVLNSTEARFECLWGRGCPGYCCQNGRPAATADEAERIDRNLQAFLPHLRPEARAVLARDGYLSRRRKDGRPMMRVVDGWCIFFNQGCVLHKVGAAEGDPYRYKPLVCAAFPVTDDGRGRLYVRQKGYRGEVWNLPCLDPAASPRPAVETLQDEVGLLSARIRPDPGRGHDDD